MISTTTAGAAPSRDEPAPESVASSLARLLARTALLTAFSMLFWGVLPALFGWHATTVMSDSMAPRLMRGDIVVSMPVPAERVRVGQIALFDDPDHAGRLRMHRVIAVSPARVFTTKGDANAVADSTPVAGSAMRGVAVLRVPYLAYPVVWLRDGELVPLALFGLGLAATIALALPPARPAAHRASPPRGRRRVPAVALTVLVVGAAVGVGATSAVPSYSSFTSASTEPTSSFSAASSFAPVCPSAVPPIPAYAFYRFSETVGGTTPDSSGNGRTATLRGGVTHVAGSCGNAPAITFDGSTGALNTPVVAQAPSILTVSMWFRTEAWQGGKLIGFGNAASGASTVTDRNLYMSDDGKLHFAVNHGGEQTISSTRDYNDGSWHQVTATLSGAGMHLYVDGAQVAGNASVTSGLAIANGHWRVGYDSVASLPDAPMSAHLAASVSDVAIYGTAFTSAQVADSYAAGR